MRVKFLAKGSVVLFIVGSMEMHAAINQEEFHAINETVVNNYRNIVLNKTNNIIEISELWDDFGGAFKTDSLRKLLYEDKMILTLTGKVAKYEGMHEDGYAIVVCHEMGHLLGGAPKQSRVLASWSSVEGQADYYATNKCMWDYILTTEKKFLNSLNDNESAGWCKTSFSPDDNKTLGCLRIMNAIIAMQNYFNATSSKDRPVSIFEHENIKVRKTLEKFPSDQCRLDTLLAGLFNKERPGCWLAS